MAQRAGARQVPVDLAADRVDFDALRATVTDRPRVVVLCSPNVLTQAGVTYAVEMGAREIERRRELVVSQRTRVLRELHVLPVDAPESEANFVWLRAAGLTGAQLAAGMEQARVIVAPGGPLGADDHARASIRGTAATDRLLRAIREATGSDGSR